MPANCIAPGCTSGYKSNPEKIHFFMVPKDKNIFTLWQNAIRRKDIRAGQFVCEKHFLAEDILWKREIKDSNEHVLGISPYKVPRLRKGTIPSQFPWTEIPISMDNNNTPLQDTPLQETAHKSEQNDLQEIISDEPSKFSFTDLFTCTLRIPVNWTRRTVVYEGIEIESFINVTCRKIENSFMTVHTKELIVQDNLSFKINVMCKPFDATSLGIYNDAISNIEEIEDTLIALDLKNICCGVPSVNKIFTYNSSISYVDNIGTVRHKQCIILLDSERQCTYCKRLDQTLKRKKLRLENKQIEM